MVPLPSLSFGSSSSATSGVKGDTSQGGSTAGGGSGTHGGFTNNFAGIGSQLAAGSPQLWSYIAIGLVAVVVVWWVWKKS